MPSFPDIFYYSELVSNKEFTELPSGRIDVNRLLQQKADFWEKPCYQQGEKKKKQLIFSDWRVVILEADERLRYAYMRCLQTLLDEGFKLWLPTEDKLIPLNNVSDLSTYCENTWKPSVSMVVQWLTQQGIARDHIAILDYFVMGQCFPELYVTTEPENLVTCYFYQNTRINSTLLKMSDLQQLEKLHPQQYLQISNELLAQPPISLNAIMDVDVNEEANAELLDLFARLPIKQLLLTKVSDKTLQTIESPAFSSEINGLYVDLPHLLPSHIDPPSKLKGLSYKGGAIDSLKLLLKRSNSLEVLNLDTHRKLSGLLEGVALVDLMQLNLSFIQFNTVELSNFLMGCPRLQKLKFYYCQTDLSGLFREVEFVELIELHLTATNFIAAELEFFLMRCSKLQKLSFNNYKKDVGDLFKKVELVELLELNLASTHFNAAKSGNFLTRCSKLQKINFSNCPTNLSGLFKEVELVELIELDLSHNQFNVAELRDFLTRCPKLQKLNFSQCKVDLSGLFKEVALIDLRELNLSSTHFNTVELKGLLTHCPKLQKLSFRNCKTDLSGLFKEVKFPKLTELSLYGLINDEELDDLKARHPNLKIDNSKPTTNASSRRSHQAPASSSQQPPTTVDANTTFIENAEATPTQVYFTPDLGVEHYRLFIFDHLSMDEGYLKRELIKAVPKRIDVQPSFVEHIEILNKNKLLSDKTSYVGQIVITLNTTDWKPLPSLSPNEQLIAYHANAKLEFAYIDNSNQYFVRLVSSVNAAQQIQIQYQLKFTEQRIPWENMDVTPELIQQVHQLRFHADGTLQENAVHWKLQALTPQKRIAVLSSALQAFGNDTSDRSQHMTVKDFTTFNYLLEQQVGACRHRTDLFLALSKPLGIISRVVLNDCHAFIEVRCEEKWIKQDLGGYSAQLQINSLKTFTHSIQGKNAEKFFLLNEEIITATHPSTHSIQEKNSEKFLLLNEEIITATHPEEQATVIPLPPPASFSEALVRLHTSLSNYPSNQQQALLIFSSTAEIEPFYFQLRDKKAQDNQRVLYLSSFRELAFQSIQASETDYNRIDTPFIRDLKQLKSGDVLLINYDRYQMTDVGYNALFDTSRRLGDILIPEGVLIIAAMDSISSQQMGEDVLSRFPVKQAWTVSLSERVTLEPVQIASENSSSLIIDLYDGSDWKEQLTGQLHYTGKAESPFTFKSGAFQLAIAEKNKMLEIRHAPINSDSSCKRFFADLVTYRCIESNGTKISLPESLAWQLTHPNYAFDRKIEVTVESMQVNVAWDYLLSLDTIGELFQAYSYCNETHTFSNASGLLETYANKTLRLYVTQPLSNGMWARLYQVSADHDCQLHLILGDKISLPAGLKAQATIRTSIKSECINPTHCFFASCYVSQDAALTVRQLKSENNNVQVISIDSQTSTMNLVSPITVNTAKLPSALPSFNVQEGELLKSLKAGKTIILKGSFSPELANRLASLFATEPFLIVNGEVYRVTKGQVILVTEQKDVFAYLAKNKQYREVCVTAQDRLKQLEQDGVSNTVLEKFKRLPSAQRNLLSYTQLQTIIQTLETQPTKNPVKPFSLFFSNTTDFEPLIQLGKELKQPIFSDVEKIPLKSNQEEKQRLQKLKTQLDFSPYVFIMGPSGIGKSTLILEKLQPYYADNGQTLRLSVGMDTIVSWASNTNSNETHILFLDEANLSKNGSFDVFEGLFDNPPKILIQGKQYLLTCQHKVIFCGNPADFQGRQTHQFFQRHGHGLKFKDWSDQFLLDTILYPLLERVRQVYSLTLSTQETEEIAQLLLKGYRSLSNQTQQSLTPRNLQMMLLRFAALCQKSDLKQTPLQKAYLALYDEIKPYLSKSHRKQWKLAFQQGETYRDLRSSYSSASLLPLGKYYIVPPSRRRALQLIQDQLAIREQRIKQSTLKQAGLHGLLLEGASGIGKSALAIEQLRECGYQENHEKSTQRYYYLTLTDPGKSEEVLTKAFHEGAIVVIDELNTAPVEKILNALLSGVDLTGKPAQQAGFLVIATQNPITFANRQPLSPALANRFYKINVKDYSLAELQHILIHKGMKPSVAKAEVNAYAAHNNNTSIDALKFTPRDLFRRH